ncbi:MAG: patatin [Rhodothermales bacterium]|nr:patatin [Rhodothermales bacterium]
MVSDLGSQTMQNNLISRMRGLLSSPPEDPRFGMLLSGGGARSSYQAGILTYIGEEFPDANFPILTGVSAGAINVSHLASAEGSFLDAARYLVDCWNDTSQEKIFESQSSFSLIKGYFKSRSPDTIEGLETTRGLLQTNPLRLFLADKLNAVEGRIPGIGDSLRSGRVEAVAIVTTNYTTGQTVTWVQGSDIEGWQRPTRVGIQSDITVEHIMASTSLPLLFPAIQIGGAWYGDGGIRFSAPLAPLVHLGAQRILAISTRYDRSRSEADMPEISGYPATTRIFGLLLNAVFLDALDQDARTMARINSLLRQLPRRKRKHMRPIHLLVMRPSVDLGKLAAEHENKISGALGLITRSLGSSGSSKSPDWLSMLLFEREYIQQLIEIGYEDARTRRSDIEEFLTV